MIVWYTPNTDYLRIVHISYLYPLSWLTQNVHPLGSYNCIYFSKEHFQEKSRKKCLELISSHVYTSNLLLLPFSMYFYLCANFKWCTVTEACLTIICGLCSIIAFSWCKVKAVSYYLAIVKLSYLEIVFLNFSSIINLNEIGSLESSIWRNWKRTIGKILRKWDVYYTANVIAKLQTN